MYKNKNITKASHLLVWLLLFSLPYILSYGQEQDIDRIIAHFWIPLFFSAIIFYVNFLVLIDRFFFTKEMTWFLVSNIILVGVFLWLKVSIEDTCFSEIAQDRPNKKGSNGPPFKMFVYIQSMTYIAPVLFSIAIKSTKKWVQTEAERKEAANIKLKSEIQHLHYQLQPHFFFNSLNNIYALVDISPEQAKSSIHSLSKLMRYMLYETNVETIPLTKEIDFMKKYIDLMKLRLSDKTKVSYNFPSEETGIQIAPLLFISLIENAFKHGVSANKGSHIHIDLVCKDNTINLSVENDNFPKIAEDKSGSGIGIQNVKKRLELLYPNKYSFETTIKENRFVAQLEIQTN